MWTKHHTLHLAVEGSCHWLHLEELKTLSSSLVLIPHCTVGALSLTESVDWQKVKPLMHHAHVTRVPWTLWVTAEPSLAHVRQDLQHHGMSLVCAQDLESHSEIGSWWQQRRADLN